jgi:uncharacterized coiled-coil protein SlyX
VDEQHDVLRRAEQHLATVSSLVEGWRAGGRLSRWRTGTAVVAAGCDELQAAARILLEEVDRQRARDDVLGAAVDRLELVSAGDERLIDDLSAAVEELQRQLDRVVGRQDLLAEREGQ